MSININKTKNKSDNRISHVQLLGCGGNIEQIISQRLSRPNNNAMKFHVATVGVVQCSFVNMTSANPR